MSRRQQPIPPPGVVAFIPDEAMSPAEIRHEIARLAGLHAHKCGVRDTFTIMMRIAGALEAGGRA